MRKLPTNPSPLQAEKARTRFYRRLLRLLRKELRTIKGDVVQVRGDVERLVAEKRTLLVASEKALDFLERIESLDPRDARSVATLKDMLRGAIRKARGKE